MITALKFKPELPTPTGSKPVGVEINVSNWSPGMYITAVYIDGKPVGRGKFVVQ